MIVSRILRVAAIFGLIVLYAKASEAIDRNVTVNSGTLSNPVGVGFGHWEGAEPLLIRLSADPGEIATAEMYAPEDVIWNQTASGPPDPWVFETAAILPDEAFAVKFRGTYVGGPGTEPPPVWAVAVSDIDLDCDSDNDSVDISRPPSESESEDASELADGNSSTSGRGMRMSLGEGWAQLKVKANVKRTSTLAIHVSNPLAFEIADAAFSILTTLPNPNTSPSAGDVCVFEKTVAPGEGPWVFYVRPSASATKDDVATITSVLLAQGPSQAAPSQDAVAVKATNEWTFGDNVRYVIVEADKNYSDPVSPARPTSITVRPPANTAADTKFKIKLRHPDGESSKLRVFLADGKTLVSFTNDVSDTAFDAKETKFWLRGLDSTVAAAPGNASKATNDQGFDIHLVEGAALADNPVLKSDWTSIWVALAIDITGSAPFDNDAVAALTIQLGTRRLGQFGDGTNGRFGINFVVQIRGNVSPKDFTKRFDMRRTLLSSRTWIKRGDRVESAGGAVTQPDNSFPAFVDDDPQSGGSNGVIYDIDAPGVTAIAGNPLNAGAIAPETIVAKRDNFEEWVVLADERCSERFPWFDRRAVMKDANGLWNPINSLPTPGAGTDNTAGRGSTPLGIDLGAHSPVASLKYVSQGDAYTFTGSVQGQGPRFQFEWVLNALPPEGRIVNGVEDVFRRTLTTDNINHGEHNLQLTVRQADRAFDIVSVTIYTNNPPTVRIVKRAVDTGRLVLSGQATDPEQGPIRDLWSITYIGQNGQIGAPVTGPFGLNEFSRQIPNGALVALVLLECTDDKGASASDAVVVDLR